MRGSNWVLALMIGFYPVNADAKDTAPRPVVNACKACHGREGNLPPALIPRINAQKPHYILRRLAQLSEMESGADNTPHAGLFAANVPAQRKSQVAEYFAALPASPPDGSDPSRPGAEIYRHGIPARNVAPCTFCHGVPGAEDGTILSMAGPRKAYLEISADSLGRIYLPGSGAMHFAVGAISVTEIDAISSYLSAE